MLQTFLIRLSTLIFCAGLPALSLAQTVTNSASPASTQVAVTFSGGYDTDPRDRGRPVILIAAALGVPDDVFREAFTHVHPAGPGEQPQTDQVRANKAALMGKLSPYGVTDDRLNEVSNYYRYSRSRGEMWRTVPAAAVATLQQGVITGITIIQAGAGYSSPPILSINGTAHPEIKVTLAYGTAFDKNGSIKEIVLPVGKSPSP